MEKIDFKHTLNLPRTDFPMKAELPKREPSTVKFWREKDIYGAIRKKRKKSKKLILHDGPPYANGPIHMGHALNKILKDMAIRYWTLKGYDSPYVPGWDCHGLPVEHQLFKELNKTKHDIPQVEFRKKAKDYAMRYVNIQCEEFKRLGIFGDWDNPYLTLSPAYEADIIRSFNALVKKGYIYKDRKPVNWCYRCETALAEAEVEYVDKSSPSIYVKFKVEDSSRITQYASRNTHFVVWTTTPWTLLANVAIAVHPDLEYSVVSVNNEEWVMASELAGPTMEKLGMKGFKVTKRIKGKELEGIACRHPFIERDARVILADFVSKEEGSGCVHIAPGHGEEDYSIGRVYKLPMVMPVDHKGRFDETCGEFSGMQVNSANKAIVERMQRDGTLLKAETVTHSYPHCWRCKTAIIFRATEQYFMNVDHRGLRKKVLKSIQKDISWIPAIGMGRIRSMVETRPDWCLSRQRYWGVPIPAFYCKNCKGLILDNRLIEHFAKIVETEGSDAWFERDVPELLPSDFACEKCKQKEFIKETDIIDVWFDSGVSHQAVLKRNKELDYPCKLYLEGSDQHRGWFQSALITSMAIDGIAPYRTALTHGFVVDGKGKKMSKSLGNVISPQDVMVKFGADILRLWVASSNYSDDVRLSDEILKRLSEAYRKIRNTFRYLLSNVYDFEPSRDKVRLELLMPIDRWMLSRLAHLVEELDRYYTDHLFYKVYHTIYSFCVYEVSSLYLDVLKDRLYTFRKTSAERRSAQTVIFEILNVLVRTFSPILVFTTEEVWQKVPFFNSSRISVHLSDWPSDEKVIKRWQDKKTDEKWARIFAIREDVLKLLEEKRMAGAIGSSLEAKVILYSADKKTSSFLKENRDLLTSAFIVSQVDIPDMEPAAGKVAGTLPITIKVENADGKKCQRCWNYSVSVGEDAENPLICNRCVHTITGGKK